MDSIVRFSFREQFYTADYLISQESYPTYIFAWFHDAELVKEFGNEICIHTDGDNMLDEHIHAEKWRQLFTAVFKAISSREALFNNPKPANRELE